MNYAKIRLPKSDAADEAFFKLIRTYRLVGVREEGEVLYQVPMEALNLLEQMAVPYDLLESNLAEPVGPTGVR